MHRQTRIFAPFNGAYPIAHWYENILGRIIKPITEKWDKLDWFWFSRYIEPQKTDSNYDSNKVVGIYIENDRTRSVMLRYSIKDILCNAFEDDLLNGATENNCLITDFRDWDKVGDVGSGRHIGGIITPERQERRAERNTRYFHQISLLALDVLDIPDTDDNYSWEMNNANDIPEPKSSFHTPHHIFCNITQVPLKAQVKVWTSNGEISVRTETGWGAHGYYGGLSTSNQLPNLIVNMPTDF
jgi:hypothetical protein